MGGSTTRTPMACWWHESAKARDSGGNHGRVYSLDTNRALVERVNDGGVWSAGGLTGPDAAPAPGTAVAATAWNSGGVNHVRVYYQNTKGVLVERVNEGGGWY